MLNIMNRRIYALKADFVLSSLIQSSIKDDETPDEQ